MMRSGSLNPHFFDYPSLYMYVQAGRRLPAVPVRRHDRRCGHRSHRREPEDFYVWGRAVTALFGTATVWIVYRIGMRWGTRAGAARGGTDGGDAAARARVALRADRRAAHVLRRCRHAALAARARGGTTSAFAWAGAAAGLAAATKYNGALALIMPLLACAMTPDGDGPRLHLASVTAFAAASRS